MICIFFTESIERCFSSGFSGDSQRFRIFLANCYNWQPFESLPIPVHRINRAHPHVLDGVYGLAESQQPANAPAETAGNVVPPRYPAW